MIRTFYCWPCFSEKKHLVVKMGQRSTQLSNPDTRISVKFAKQCLSCDETTTQSIPLGEWKHLKQED